MTKKAAKPRRPKSRYWLVFDIYKATDGWRWRAWSRNGRIIAHSGEGYRLKAHAIRMCEVLQDRSEQSAIFVEGVELT